MRWNFSNILILGVMMPVRVKNRKQKKYSKIIAKKMKFCLNLALKNLSVLMG